MSDTPRTDKVAQAGSHEFSGASWVRADFARQLERELAASEARVKELTIQVSNQQSMLNGKHEYIGQDFAFRIQRKDEQISALESRLARVTEAVTRLVAALDDSDFSSGNDVADSEADLALDGVHAALAEQPDDGSVLVEQSVVQDAERYRWLNNQDNFMVYVEDKKGHTTRLRLKCGDALDRYIDSARKENPDAK